MKQLLLFVLLCSMASAQVGTGTTQGPIMQNTVVPQDHPETAQYTNMATERNLLPTSAVTVAQGERPLSDFPSDEPVVSLGQIAREYKEHHPVKRPKITVIP